MYADDRVFGGATQSGRVPPISTGVQYLQAKYPSVVDGDAALLVGETYALQKRFGENKEKKRGKRGKERKREEMKQTKETKEMGEMGEGKKRKKKEIN